MVRNQPQFVASVPRDAVAACRDVTRQYAHTFYFGSLLMDARRRAAVWAVYAACRGGDNIVDEDETLTVDERRRQLDAWWRCVEATYAGEVEQRSTWGALAWAVATFPIPLSAFKELYEGFLMDLDGNAIASLSDLELYCRRVGGVVGYMVAPICGYRGGEETLTRALRLGQAMQLTNILRDVGEDLLLNRIYLPGDYLVRHKCDRAMLEGGKVTPEYRALMEELVGLARGWYKEARPGIASLHGPARLAIAFAAMGYEGILDSLEQNHYDNFSRRAFVSRRRKLALVPTTLWQLRTFGGFGV
jgi:15-cis-phytoene synthase